MKKLLCCLLIVISVLFTFTSCKSMKKFEKRLGDDYEVKMLEEDELEDLCESFDIDMKEFKVKKAMMAEDEEGFYGYVIKCGSKGKAKKLVEELEDIVKLLSVYYPVEVEASGKYVVIGSESVVEAALKK